MRIPVLLFISFLLSLNTASLAKVKKAEIASEYYTNHSPDAESVEFSRIVFNVPSSKDIGDINFGGFCAKERDYTLDNNKFEIEDSMFVNTFVEVLTDANYVMSTNPNALFVDESVQSRYHVGAVIKDMEYDICYYNDMFKGPVSKGENYLLIEWQVYDALERKVVLTVESEGYAKQKKTVVKGSTLALQNSFRGAVYNLLANKAFHDLVQPETSVFADPSFDQLNLDYEITGPDSEDVTLADATESVVTIKAGGHGSGFIISEDGYILTNQHVVGEHDTVIVSFMNGMEIEGQVIRRASIRDVALVKVPLRRLKPLSLQPKEPDIGTDVYAIGSPLDTSLSGTVSQGIISAFRMMDDQEFIQSDAQINGGNSGGPMVDQHGNVVAVSVSGYDNAEGINFFIPIKFALEALNIEKTSVN